MSVEGISFTLVFIDLNTMLCGRMFTEYFNTSPYSEKKKTEYNPKLKAQVIHCPKALILSGGNDIHNSSLTEWLITISYPSI